MFTLVGYSESQDTGGVLTYVQALADQHVRIEGDNIVVPGGMANLLGVYANGMNITEARVEAPSLRRTLLLDLPFVDRGWVQPSSPHYMFDAFYNPIPLDEFEPIRGLIAEDAVGAEQGTVLLWLGDGPQSPVTGEIYTVKANSYASLATYEWTNGSLTMVQTLPSGSYQVVGMRAEAPGLIAARLVFVGGTWRPGVLAASSVDEKTYPLFNRGALGVWGEFTHDQPPTVDYLTATAGAEQTVWLDLIKVA